MPSPAATAPSAPAWTEAGLRVGVDDASYRCAGRGGFVLALSRRDDARFARHCDAIAARARVVVPVLGDRGAAVRAEWLHGLLDAFGSPPATIVADDTALLDAIHLALAYPGRVVSLRLLLGDSRVATCIAEPCLVPVAVERYIP
jgi:hypothetical protein